METDKSLNAQSNSAAQATQVLDGSKEQDYQKSFKMLLEMIDLTLDEYKGDLQQVLFPIFIILYLTLIRRDFEKSAELFFGEF